jgi:hypothetical protein
MTVLLVATMDSVLHTLNDGTTVRCMRASALLKIPVWKGNRIIDSAHVAAIAASIEGNVKRLDSGYHLVKCPVEDAGGATILSTYLIDGQHRHAVLHQAFDVMSDVERAMEDFDVLVFEHTVASEIEIIDAFNTLNSVKPIQWSEPVLVVNTYIELLEKEFNVGKSKMIRGGTTRRPYLSVERLREALTDFALAGRLRPRRDAVARFVERVREWNTREVAGAGVAALGASGKDADRMLHAAGLKFMLAYDPRLPWIAACLTTTA